MSTAEPFKIFIYCDHPGHPRRVAVTNFVSTPDGGWHEVPASRAGQRAGTGYHLRGDTPAVDGWALAGESPVGEGRDKFLLSCRKCKGRPFGQRAEPVDVRVDTLLPVLDGWRTAGVSEVSLVMLAASLGRSNKQDRTGRKPSAD